MQDPVAPEYWTFGTYMTNEAILETNFPARTIFMIQPTILRLRRHGSPATSGEQRKDWIYTEEDRMFHRSRSDA